MAVREHAPLDTDTRQADTPLVKRHFTDGTHPFEHVAWERRDAIIPGREGNVFEQRDVEFPATWSQNDRAAVRHASGSATSTLKNVALPPST